MAACDPDRTLAHNLGSGQFDGLSATLPLANFNQCATIRETPRHRFTDVVLVSQMLSFASFDLESVTLEARYHPAYLLWDRSGAIWSNATKRWPGLTRRNAQPNETSFFLGHQFEFGSLLDRCYLIERFPRSNLSDFKSAAEFFVNLVADNLEIEEFTRIGFRLVFTHEFNSLEDASMYTSELCRTSSFPQSKTFNIQGKVMFPELIFRWEDEKFGVRVSLRCDERKVEISVPSQTKKLQDQSSNEALSILDVDYYLKTSLTRHKLKVSAWIDQMYHVIRRDLKKIVEQP